MMKEAGRADDTIECYRRRHGHGPGTGDLELAPNMPLSVWRWVYCSPIRQAVSINTAHAEGPRSVMPGAEGRDTAETGRLTRQGARVYRVHRDSSSADSGLPSERQITVVDRAVTNIYAGRRKTIHAGRLPPGRRSVTGQSSVIIQAHSSNSLTFMPAFRGQLFLHGDTTGSYRSRQFITEFAAGIIASGSACYR